MKINNINSIKSQQYNQKIKNETNKPKQEYKQINQLQNNVMFMPFMGGYSVDLVETNKNLLDEDYPSKDVQKRVLEYINNNELDKTLYDAHFDVYKGISDCYSLDELKEKYPEFSNVVSSYDVDAKDKSFISKFQNDELKVFPNDEDLSLQLIKLYWGQGFSLSDLSKFLKENEEDGINLHYTMQKLNIPFMKPKYANVLKLSNKEYNESFTNNLSIKIKEAQERRQQIVDGEPVIIPRGELSEAHKQHISLGLKKYYQEHPDKIYELSERQKQYYIDNEDQREKMSQVMLYAWNETQEGKGLLKHIKRFMKKNKIDINMDELAYKKDLSKEQKTLLHQFWEKNTWAKKELSKAVIKGYEYVNRMPTEKEENKLSKDYFAIERIPKKLQQKVIEWAKRRHYPVNLDYFAKGFLPLKEITEEEHKKLQEQVITSNNVLNWYLDKNPEKADNMASTYIRTFYKFNESLIKAPENLPESIRDDDVTKNILSLFLYSVSNKYGLFDFNSDGTIKVDSRVIDTNTLNNAYMDLNTRCYSYNPEILEYLNQLLNQSYDDLNH